MPIPITVPSVLWIISSNSNSPRWDINCITSIEEDSNDPHAIATIHLCLQERISINSIPIGMNNTKFQNTSDINIVFPSAIAL